MDIDFDVDVAFAPIVPRFGRAAFVATQTPRALCDEREENRPVGKTMNQSTETSSPGELHKALNDAVVRGGFRKKNRAET